MRIKMAVQQVTTKDGACVFDAKSPHGAISVKLDEASLGALQNQRWYVLEKGNVISTYPRMLTLWREITKCFDRSYGVAFRNHDHLDLRVANMVVGLQTYPHGKQQYRLLIANQGVYATSPGILVGPYPTRHEAYISWTTLVNQSG